MTVISLQFARFLIVGLGSNAVNFLLYISLHGGGLPIVVASVTGYLAGLIVSFSFGKSWVFEHDGPVSRSSVARFVAVYAVGGVGMTMIVDILHTSNGFDYRLSWLCGAAFAVINNFLGSKWFAFRQRPASHDR